MNQFTNHPPPSINQVIREAKNSAQSADKNTQVAKRARVHSPKTTLSAKKAQLLKSTAPSKTVQFIEPTYRTDPFAPKGPLTYNDVALYTSARRLEKLPDSSNPSPALVAPDSPPGIPVFNFNNSITKFIPVNTILPDQIPGIKKTPLPAPTLPPLLSQAAWTDLTPKERTTMADQRAYATLFHSLERDGGWFWWEKDCIDVDAIDQDFGLATTDIRKRKEMFQRPTDRHGNVLGEEEEEEKTPEHEWSRTENHKALAATVLLSLQKGATEGLFSGL